MDKASEMMSDGGPRVSGGDPGFWLFAMISAMWSPRERG